MKRSFTNSLRRFAIGVLLASGPGVAWAQEFRATITGRVTDPAGLVVPGVAVTARNVQTNEAATSVSTDAGIYTIPFLNPGSYVLTAELSGFKTFNSSPLQLEVGQAARLNIQLQIGDVAE
ncbi:MAG: carboxypeptidase regulatory-like domain-containing protein, partial [Acidobacteria bacterium]|nr:carboxypeptidase regulatory-like domain-containing protein [Acidobacteriota bacterium]